MKRERWKKTCGVSRKVAYASRKRALNALNTERALGANGRLRDRLGVPCAIYKCPHCGEWHLTSREQG